MDPCHSFNEITTLASNQATGHFQNGSFNIQTHSLPSALILSVISNPINLLQTYVYGFHQNIIT